MTLVRVDPHTHFTLKNAVYKSAILTMKYDNKNIKGIKKITILARARFACAC